ncbi:RND transporter [Sulfurifustis variabilis]|uniref:RND transporter n=1 Tax=Sulfurifustis variabilis TaxID=1675686 RepID=A0A1B4V6W8_9GAMM|nr:efflux transporter outer membrane subunit [Sulfurifustis variabilis]BAU49195.1 RND transporter [Sulfurifustis variabilis]
MRLVSRFCAVGALLALGGCVTVGPDYAPPATQAPEAWRAGAAAGASAAPTDPATLARWWSVLQDPVLTRLIERAASGSLDLRQAQARVREARARRGIASADRFPTLAAAASASRVRGSEETGTGATTELYAAAFDARWELDLFGSKRRALESATAGLEASVADAQDVYVSLLAEVALNYVEVRSFQTRLAIAEANLGTQTETYDITRWRAQAGLTTELDVQRARFNLEQTRAEIPSLRSGLEQAKNRLAVLLGERPGALAPELDAPAAIPVVPAEVAVGVPADVLRRRPDVRAAERRLAAQTAEVGVAAAARYPGFALLGSIGLEALTGSRLFTSAARTSTAAANASWTVFDAGRLRRNVEVQGALAEQALIGYEAAVLTALNDVENALVAFGEEQARRAALVDATRAAELAANLATQQYNAGLIDFQVVLDAQRSLLSLQDRLAASEGEVSSNLIRLYKALGGGWTPLAAADAAAKEGEAR